MKAGQSAWLFVFTKVRTNRPVHSFLNQTHELTGGVDESPKPGRHPRTRGPRRADDPRRRREIRAETMRNEEPQEPKAPSRIAHAAPRDDDLDSDQREHRKARPEKRCDPYGHPAGDEHAGDPHGRGDRHEDLEARLGPRANGSEREWREQQDGDDPRLHAEVEDAPSHATVSYLALSAWCSSSRNGRSIGASIPERSPEPVRRPDDAPRTPGSHLRLPKRHPRASPPRRPAALPAMAPGAHVNTASTGRVQNDVESLTHGVQELLHATRADEPGRFAASARWPRSRGRNRRLLTTASAVSLPPGTRTTGVAGCRKIVLMTRPQVGIDQQDRPVGQAKQTARSRRRGLPSPAPGASVTSSRR